MNTIALKDCCRFLSGGTPSKAKPEFWSGKIPWFSPKDIKSLHLVDSEDHITEEAVSASATQKVRVGTILVVGRSGVLAHTLPVGILGQEAAFNQDIKAIVPSNICDPEFIALFLKAQEERVLSVGVKVGATVHSLRSGFIESLEIPVLGIHDQRRLASELRIQLAAVEQARQAAYSQLEEIERLPSRLLTRAFENI